MPGSLKLSFFGSSVLSSYQNTSATYYRGILKNLARRGYEITFFEADLCERRTNRDLTSPPEWARIQLYAANWKGLREALDSAEESDILVKASSVGIFDEVLEREVLLRRHVGQKVYFWDVNAPVTLDQIESNEETSFRSLIPDFDGILTFGGGDLVCRKYRSLGARSCTPIYNAVDPETHYPVAPEDRFRADVAFLGNRLPDRERQVDSYFLSAAENLPRERFILGGSGWKTKKIPLNVRYLGHVSTNDHNAFNSSARIVLNLSRESSARHGHTPATRVFEAAGAGACIITDAWDGIENFLEPAHEIIVARKPHEVIEVLNDLDGSTVRKIGARARERILSEHTYLHRTQTLDSVFRA